ncbi:MAG: hypothetical protein IJ880_03105 [Bacilli bacterium]|nr:hypothetical protein [Bacilli bacterium]
MIKDVIESWEKNKHFLQELIETTNQDKISYNWFVTNISKLILDIEDPIVHEINDGEYQGTMLYLITDNSIYQPSVSNYYFTYVWYGSCSGCDALEGIRCYSNELPDDKQVKEYMTLCLHIVQRIKLLSE